MNTAKAQAETLLQRLPDDCTYDDIHYHLYVIEKIRRGLESADQEGTISQSAQAEHSWERFAGMFEDEPLLDEVLEDIEARRREDDGV